MERRNITPTLLLFVLLAIVSCGSDNKRTTPVGVSGVRYIEPEKSGDVYVCTGRYAKRFHNDEECKGLQSCRSEIVTMSIEEAENLGLTPCGYCY